MKINQGSTSKTLMAILVATAFSACVSPPTLHSETMTPETTISDITQSTKSTSASVNDATTHQAIKVTFLTKEDSIKLLATEDDYINALSDFDWQAKFKSERKLTPQALSDYYSKAAINWDAALQQKVTIAVELLERKIAGLNLNRPWTHKFVLTNGLVESGAAYTREDYIVLPINLLDDTQTQDDINHLVAHEFFHVYSRFNKANRDALYAATGFVNLPPISLPSYIKSMLITNPDAPDLQYGIELDYQDKRYTFLPLLMSKMDYDETSDVSFFAYIRDGLLAVEPANGIMRPVLVDGTPIFVHKKETNYDAVVQPNSAYLNHPEEVTAEHFSLWVVDDELAHKAPVNKLIDVMKSIH